MISSPRVSILMSVRNGDNFLSSSLESLLMQTFQDFELIIVNDGSCDGTSALLQEFYNRDKRIRIITNPVSMGLTRSLNVAFEQSSGEYIARQDADDWSDSNRIACQVQFFDRNPHVILLGSAFHEVDSSGRILRTCRPPRSDAAIRWQMFFHGAFCHSSVMFRRDAFLRAGGYDENFTVSQDYDLWSRMLSSGAAANLRVPLVYLRRHPDSVSAIKRENQDRAACLVAGRNFTAVSGGGNFDFVQMRLLRSWYYSPYLTSAESNLDLARHVFALIRSLASDQRFSRTRLTLERFRWLAKLWLTCRVPFGARVEISKEQFPNFVRRFFGFS